MEWFDAAENPALCEGPLGPVLDAETVARLLHETTIEPEKNRFPRNQLFAPNSTEQSHICAQKDGASVDRCDNLNDAEIDKRSEVQASRRPGRAAKGAHYAAVEAVRAIRLPHDADRQIFKVYDDARLVADEFGGPNTEHAVIRGDSALSRAQQTGAIEMIIRLFRPARPGGNAPSAITF